MGENWYERIGGDTEEMEGSMSALKIPVEWSTEWRCLLLVAQEREDLERNMLGIKS